jgi:hypothetical protein
MPEYFQYFGFVIKFSTFVKFIRFHGWPYLS